MVAFYCLLILLCIHNLFGEIIECNVKETGSCSCDNEILGEICTLNCRGKDQCQDGILKCRKHDSCIINCIGDNSCSGNANIIATDSNDVYIICGNTDSCKGNTNLYCGTGYCHIICSQYSSCEQANIHSHTASAFSCSPSSNCNNAASDTTPFINTTPIPTAMIKPVPSEPVTSTPQSTQKTTSQPTSLPSSQPTPMPTPLPSPQPSQIPTPIPTPMPTPWSTPQPMATPQPSSHPTPIPTPWPSPQSTPTPTDVNNISVNDHENGDDDKEQEVKDDDNEVEDYNSFIDAETIMKSNENDNDHTKIRFILVTGIICLSVILISLIVLWCFIRKRNVLKNGHTKHTKVNTVEDKDDIDNIDDTELIDLNQGKTDITQIT